MGLVGGMARTAVIAGTAMGAGKVYGVSNDGYLAILDAGSGEGAKFHFRVAI